MCGIIGYIGKREACPILIEGLGKLEYRGYDSAGVAVMNSGKTDVRKCMGKLRALEDAIRNDIPRGSLGIGHTRWATHGGPSDANSHPHTDCAGNITVVHNGIIENYMELKEALTAEGHTFVSETDTEVAAHLIEKFYDGNISEAVCRAAKMLQGSFALVVICNGEPDRIVAARRYSPLVVGLGKGENFLSSDVGSFLSYTRDAVYIDDDTAVTVTADSYSVTDFDGNPIRKEVHKIEWDASMAERGGYEHFMLKEIHEQPRALRETMRGRLSPDSGNVELPGLNLSDEYIKSVDRIRMIACGTAYHASMAAKYAIESLCKIHVDIDFASELRYREPLIDERTLAVVISQSGETLDTIVGLREAKENGAKVVSITNVVGSMAAREADGVLYTYAGPEIAVASTKAYTTQLMVLYMLALYIARIRGTVAPEDAKKYCEELWDLPEKAEIILNDYKAVREAANRYYCFNGFLYMARGINLASALEGALKIKEISYMHAEGYAAGEMKHGPIAMIDPTFATIAMCVKSKTYDKMLSNIREVKARAGEVIAIATNGDELIESYADKVIYIPETLEVFSPVLVAIPLQLMAYQVAKNRGPAIDQPRNLAKTVTVE
ncbi:MAG: glutamine--fructose-6-phosphate transaminase (isomerizing) [Abditibacteriota bacterium]|nr:glutamine--fructose-6-phosphate transaminase (isomerizing) [Abditibacteriota bacterium]MBP5093451.1 glutamine--fructose-6-phosphate transaminase (isomerizing) [Abditibacteriota bacterium]MBP5739059.1 glutamine--fructose-6-phosphate transaminase (isomerizing) [Abditibacteriota bacterium]